MGSMTRDATSGANPQLAFPNAHLAAGRTSKGAPGVAFESSSHDPIELLREAVKGENWDRVFEERFSSIRANASWSASPERCSALRRLCALHGAKRVLEVGSFCGAAALAMAAAIPKDGTVVALELEGYFAKVGQTFKAKSAHGSKITTKVGPAEDSLKALAEQVRSGELEPFDLVVVDADKALMGTYLDLIQAEGLVTRRGVVCIDVTPFKGQPPTRYVRFGATEKWVQNSGEAEIAAVRKMVTAMPEYDCHEAGGLLIVQPQASA